MNLPQALPLAFFSYAREDSDFALRLAGDLKAAGAAVWLDQLDIQPGQRWDRAVEEALTQCVRMLVVLTPAAVNSANVMDEVSFALEEGKNIIPIIHRDCAIPFRLRRLQHLDFREDYARALNGLVRALVSGTETVLRRPAVAVGLGDTAEVPLSEQQRALEETVADRVTRAPKHSQDEVRRPELEQAREANQRVQAVENGRLTDEQRLAAEQMQPDGHRRRIEESRREDKRRQAAELHRKHELEVGAGQAQKDAGGRLQLEHRQQVEGRAHALTNEERRHEYGPAAVAVADRPPERPWFDLASLWPLVDRFGGVCWLVLAFALPALLGVSLLEMSSWYTKTLGIVCPTIAAIVPAIPIKRVAIKYIATTFGMVSLLTPILGVSAMRAGIEITGSTGLAAYAAGLADVLSTLPFLVAALFAAGATTLPTAPASLYAGTRLVLLLGSALVVLIAGTNISAFAKIASVGFGGEEWPWLAAWLVRLVGGVLPG